MARKLVDVLIKYAASVVTVVMVIDEPVFVITMLTQRTTDRPRGNRSNSLTMINMSSSPTPRIKNGRNPTMLMNGTPSHIPKPKPHMIP
jgi:hypothetical protein